MTGSIPEPSGHTYLEFNAPMADGRAAALIATLEPLTGARVVDLGCGWAELPLRLLAAAPTATGAGIDTDAEAIERGLANAEERGLTDRLQLTVGDATTWPGEPADIAICVGASHAWGGTHQMLEAIRPHLRSGGRLLVGTEVWDRPPSPDALRVLGAAPDDFGHLGELVDVAISCGFRPLDVSTASLAEWDTFESRWCAGRERWLLAHPDHPDAAEVRRVVDEHRDAWLHGYRGVLGFAFLTLAC